ncbi:MAG: DUF4835 family protein [Prevotella sp.]|jgi:hypothetical protein|nr:DUF4835 family protein [Prevotella sp.]
MKKGIIIILSYLSAFISLHAQELNAKLTLNSQKVQSANKELISDLERSINQLLNEQKWTDQTFSRSEKIDCAIAITINEIMTDNTFTAEIQVSSRRPVYNSTYITSLLNYRDTQFEFSYMQGQSLIYSDMNTLDNLVAIIAYYAYIIIGFDFDSFSQNGGRPYFEKAMNIANMAQSLNTRGWEPFSGKNSSRYDLAMALTEQSSNDFHLMWYTYHRLGLDEMSANASRGRIRIMESIKEIQKLHSSRPNSPLLSLIAEAKVEEIVKICSEATTEEKQEMRKLLSQLFPTKGGYINNLK